MSNVAGEEWNDRSREDLRETLRRAIVGELRLGRLPQEKILDMCEGVYLENWCPTNERAEFSEFAAAEFVRAAACHEADQATWPPETDCDRLDRVEATLRERGILFWQVSPCCDTCTRAALGERVETIEKRHPGFRARLRGYAFFIEQAMPGEVAESTRVKLYLSYGWASQDEDDQDDAASSRDQDEQRALAIAREVCDCLRQEGFEADWNGRIDRKIAVAVDWQRRHLLE